MKYALAAAGLLMAFPALAAPAGQAVFSDIRYDSQSRVDSEAFDAAKSYENPILPGYYPDPSIERVGNDYYMVNSTFAY